MNLKSNPLVSILIVTLRGGENLRNCLTSIRNNNYNAYELVVVNNGGVQRINQEIKKIFPQAKIINLKENAGFAQGNNIGFKYCKGTYILFLNDDTIVTPDLLKVLVEFAEKNNHVAVLQPKTIFTTGKLQAGADFLTLTGFLYHYGYGKNPHNPIYNFPTLMFSANGNCMFVKKEIIEKIGLFDKDFFAYFEESDFCHRVWLAGYKIMYLPKATIYHKGSETSKILDRSIRLYHPYKNRLCAHLKNLSFPNLISILPILLVLYQAIFFYFLLKRKIFEAFYIQKAIWWNILNLPSTLRKREYIQKEIRKFPDNKFMKEISYTPRFSYFIHLISNLEKYRDDDLREEKYVGVGSSAGLNRDTNVLIATFSPWIAGKRLPTNGSVEPLINFFAPKVKKMVLIDQPYPGSDFIMPRIEVYHNQEKMKLFNSSWWLNLLLPLLKLVNKPGTHITFKLRDFLSVIDLGTRDKTKFDYFIGLESINALAGIFLRKMELVKKVIYYVSDYSPNRYGQKWFNWLYLFLDKLAAMSADYIWDVSAAIQPARIAAGLDQIKSAPVIHVPNALKPSQIRFNSLKKLIPFSLIYMGTLGKDNGCDILIQAMPQILMKYPKSLLHIIGGGGINDLPRLQRLAAKLNIRDKVEFYGYVLDGNKMAEIIRSCYLALAPYRAFEGSPRYYGDAGKIRAYAAAGLPIITTNVPPLGKEVWQKGAALIVNDTPSDFAKAIIKVLGDKKLYLHLRKNSISFAKNNTWENTFANAFKMMGNL